MDAGEGAGERAEKEQNTAKLNERGGWKKCQCPDSNPPKKICSCVCASLKRKRGKKPKITPQVTPAKVQEKERRKRGYPCADQPSYRKKKTKDIEKLRVIN